MTREQLNTVFPPPKSIRLHSVFFVRCFSWLCDLGWVPECGWMEEGLSDRAGDSGKSPPPSSHHQHSQASKALHTTQYHLSVFKRILLCRRQKLPRRRDTTSPRHPHTMPFSLLQDLLYVQEKFEIFLTEYIAYITCRSIAVWVTSVKQQELWGYKEFYR